MATKPIVSTEWATDFTTAGTSGNPNKTDPPTNIKDFGAAEAFPTARQHINYDLNALDQWKVYFDLSIDEINNNFGNFVPLLNSYLTPTLLGTTDLDTVKDTGFYYQHSNGLTAGNNYPVEEAGSLQVLRWSQVEDIIQTYTTFNNVVYVRRNDDATWTSWNKQYSENAKPTATEIGAVDLVNSYLTPTDLGTTDLDTVTDLGFYLQNTNGDTPSNNYPENVAGTLEVLQWTDDVGYRIQRYTTFDNQRIYIRVSTVGVWSDWNLQYSENAEPHSVVQHNTTATVVRDGKLTEVVVYNLGNTTKTLDSSTFRVNDEVVLRKVLELGDLTVACSTGVILLPDNTSGASHVVEAGDHAVLVLFFNGVNWTLSIK
jgi:hypothetical protein